MNTAGRSPDHCCFELGIEGDQRRYVGYHRIGAELVARPETALEALIRDGAKEIGGTLPTLMLTRSEAMALVAARRRQAIAQGFAIVANQVTRHGLLRPITLVLPNGQVRSYRSQREFARSFGIVPSTVRLWLGSRDCVDFSDSADYVDFEVLLRSGDFRRFNRV